MEYVLPRKFEDIFIPLKRLGSFCVSSYVRKINIRALAKIECVNVLFCVEKIDF